MTLVPAAPAPLALRQPDGRLSYARITDVLEMPHLIKLQTDSFRWFQEEGLRELLDEISPIQSFNKNLELYFLDYSFGAPKYSEWECRQRDTTYSVPLRVQVRLVNKDTGEIKEQEIFMGDFPLMTQNGTFVINGAERVVVSQLVRSPGVYFTANPDPQTGLRLCYGKLIPNRGAWLEFETSTKDVLSVKVDRKRKIPVTTLLRAVAGLPSIPKERIGQGSDEDLYRLFEMSDNNPKHPYIAHTIERESEDTRTAEASMLEFYKRLRPGEPPTIDNAREYLNNLFFNPRRYDLGRVGRYKMNKRLGLNIPDEIQTLTPDDLIKIVEMLIRVNNGVESSDDIDHLGNRRVRAVGELIQNVFRVGLLRMERLVKEKMSIQDPEQTTPALLINIRPVVAAIREFFGGSPLSQFMDQTNPLAELTHKRRLSALGPGGLSRERAGFDVRDVHHSHYGRICPIETPEGPNIGLIGSLATYGQINPYGFIETPYRRVRNTLENTDQHLLGQTLREDVLDGDSGEIIAQKGAVVTPELAQRLFALPSRRLKIVPVVTREIAYLSADEEEQYIIAQANAILDEHDHFVEERVSARRGKGFVASLPEQVDFMDVSPKQIVSVAAALIPFLEHDDANRALMGANMQRQAVPLLIPEAPIVETGVEGQTAQDSGQVIVAAEDGIVTNVSADEIMVAGANGRRVYNLQRYVRSNQGTCIDQRPSVNKGDRVHAGQVLVDSSSTDRGELALGQNVLVAFMSWEGCNFEDAFVISERLVRDDKFTSIQIERHEVEARDTKLGAEEITRDIPNVSEDSLRNLDESGIIRLGAEVSPGDILVGKITPKGETELTAEEKLLRAIFGEKAREVKDTSLRVPHGESGKVVEIRTLSRENRDELPVGVHRMVRVAIAQRRKIREGDKIAGRHGNKGVISKVLPIEDMPYLPDGTPVDIIMSPIGVPSRMNVGQILEAHLGWAANRLGIHAISPVFDGANEREIEAVLGRAWLAERGFDVGDISATAFKDRVQNEKTIHTCLREWLRENGEPVDDVPDEALENLAAQRSLEWGLPTPICGKSILYDGRTGLPFDQPVTIGSIYMMKLSHQVEDKIHARSTGPYSLVTQQPLGGKAQFGGQRFGEMEVWALEAYGASHILQEMLTVKSDDVIGRVKTYEAIVKGEDIMEPGVPESFKVLVKELQSLGLAVEVLNEDEERIQFAEETTEEGPPELGINIEGFENE